MEYSLGIIEETNIDLDNFIKEQEVSWELELQDSAI